MSYLLDALRKSERSGRRGSVPTIHSASPPVPRREQAGDEPLAVLAFAAPAFIVMAILGWQMFEVGPFARDEGHASAAARQEQPARGVAQPERPLEDETPTTDAPVNAAPQFVGAGRPGQSSPRTPVEQVQATPSGPARPAAAERPTETPDDPLSAAARAIQQAAAKNEAAAPARAQPQARQKPAAERPRPTTAPERQNHIDYWELPGNIRNQLPEMKISVLVYAEQPADRFILVNGQRLYEGDELQSGLVLREVRREGAVFSFRRYRFIFAN